MKEVTGSTLDSKPRPFWNATKGVWGAGSCYINAGLQCLFSFPRLQLTLAGIIAESSNTAELWRFCTMTDISDIRRQKDDIKIQSYQQRSENDYDRTVAITFAAALQGAEPDAHGSVQSLRGRALYPAAILADSYEGEQDDATSFLALKIVGEDSGCPKIAQKFRGQYERKQIYCGTCRNYESCDSAVDDEMFTSITIQSTDPDVQTALERSYRTTLRAAQRNSTTFSEKSCRRCESINWVSMHQPIRVCPEILLLIINHYEFDVHTVSYRRLESLLKLDPVIKILDTPYKLCGIVYHTGNSPTGGHYVAAVLHAEDPERFFLYNDSDCQIRSRDRLTSSAKLTDCDDIFVPTALLYERL